MGASAARRKRRPQRPDRRRVRESSFIKQDGGGRGCRPPRGWEPGREVRAFLSGHVHASKALVHAQAVLHVHLVLAAVLGRGPANGQRRGGTADLEEHPGGKRGCGGRAAVRLPPPGPGRSASSGPASPSPPPARPGPAREARPSGRSPPSPVILLDVLPVLGPADVRRRLAHDLRGQRHRGAFARLSVIRSLLNLRRDWKEGKGVRPGEGP